ncbi:MAG: PIG-L family deacetylase [Balneolaceae bacterium]
MQLTKRALTFIFAILTASNFSYAQAPLKLNAAEIKQALNKLEVLGTVLHIAAHPDDENTQLIAYMAKERNLRTAYLSMTRGDGGQNLIGTDIREYLGIIRTQELLAARRHDGGEQLFTRMNDFGYSKNPFETFNVWGKDNALADVVWNIRRFKPDVIISRFDTTLVQGGRMHGHHTASARLAMEAFDLANDPNAFPEQLKYVELWQPKTLYWNTYSFGRSFSSPFKEGDEGIFAVDLGTYNELLGKSYGEVSAIGRSEHKSQGFGRTGSRGENRTLMYLWKGEPGTQSDIFSNIDQTWNRVKGGQAVGALIREANQLFDFENPSAIVPLLMKAREQLMQIEDLYWKELKLKELDLVIKSAMGLYLEVAARNFSAVPGENVPIYFEAVNRSDIDVTLTSVEIPELNRTINLNQALLDNSRLRRNDTLLISENMPYSQPYWLVEEAELGRYRVEDQMDVGLPENTPALSAVFNLQVDGKPYSYKTGIIHKTTDRVKGEFYRPFVITPPVMASIKEGVLIFPDNEPKMANVVVTSGRDDIKGTIKLALPDGWKSNPAQADYTLSGKSEEHTIAFQVIPPQKQEEAYIGVEATFEGATYDRGFRIIEYDHIPIQTVFPKSNTKVVRVDLKKRGEHLGYIMGSGDVIPESLEQIGYQVNIIDPETITADNLKAFDAVIIGIRAYNTLPRMQVIHPILMDYVFNGGTVITQYNTSIRNVPLGPYPLEISRDRVAVEEAEVTILAPDHPIINGPNKITAKDFEGWVQERGLYFPNSWDDRYIPILSSHDPGEPPRNGGLLVTEYGQGYFIYTGYSWFRELPAGVPGAFRIFTNMISIGKENPGTH